MRAHDPAASQKSTCKAEQTPNDADNWRNCRSRQLSTHCEGAR